MAKQLTPAPEEHRTIKEFKAACVPSYARCNELFMRPPVAHQFKSLHDYYFWCWRQPEAEDLHQSWKDHKA